VKTLRIAGDLRAWHAATVFRQPNLTGVSLSGEGKRAFVEIDGRTGDLIDVLATFRGRRLLCPISNRLAQGGLHASRSVSHGAPPV
jgi:hypothetical protein